MDGCDRAVHLGILDLERRAGTPKTDRPQITNALISSHFSSLTRANRGAPEAGTLGKRAIKDRGDTFAASRCPRLRRGNEVYAISQHRGGNYDGDDIAHVYQGPSYSQRGVGTLCVFIITCRPHER